MNRVFKANRYRLILLVLLLIFFIAGCGGGAYVGPSNVYYDDMHYRNPWYGHRHHMPPPHYIGPPPVIMPPPMLAPPVAVPLPM
jgi:hypothetical protein